MSGILKFYYYLCLAVGFINLHYDPKTESLQLYHWGTILYVGVINIIALVYQPFGIRLYYDTTYYCEEFYASALMGVFVTIANSLTLAATVTEAWLKRQRFRTLCYVYRILVKQYLSESKVNENHEVIRKARNILIRKIIMSLWRMTLLYVQLYNRVEDDEYCAYMDEPHFIVATIYIGFVNMMFLLLDFTVILGFVFIDLCLKMLLKNLKRIEQDVDLMNRVYARGYGEKQKKIHRKWRLQLSEDVEAITNEVRKLQVLAEDHTEVYQVPLMFMLLSVFLTLISATFHVINYLDDSQKFNIYTFIFLTIVLIANIGNCMILFNVCEALTKDIKKLSYEVYEISIKASLTNRGSFYRDPLEINLETLTQQLRVHRSGFNVSICGFFDIHRSAFMAMICEIILNLLCIVQSAMEADITLYYDYYEYDEQY